MNNDDQLDNQIRISLANAGISPRMSSFNAVMEKMAAERRRRKRMFFYIAAGFVLLTGGLYTANSLSESQRVRNKAILEMKEPVSSDRTGNKIASSPLSPSEGVISAKANNGFTHLQANSDRVKKHSTESVVTVLNNTSGAEPLAPLASISETSVNGLQIEEMPPVAFLLEQTIDSLLSFSCPLPADGSLNKAGECGVTYFGGLGFEPQLTKFQIQENPKAGKGDSFSDQYVAQRKARNHPELNYSLSLKGGLVVGNKWELLAGVGYHQIGYTEIPLPTTSTSYNNNGGGGVTPNLVVITVTRNSPATRNLFEYAIASVGGNRLFDLGPVQLKAGLGITSEYLYRAKVLLVNNSDNYSYEEKYRGAPLPEVEYCSPFRPGRYKKYRLMVPDTAMFGFVLRGQFDVWRDI